MAQLWKSFVEALAPPRHDQQQRREGVTLNHTVGECPLSHWEANSQAMGRGSRAPPEYQEVMRANLNIPPPRISSARVAEVNSSSDEEFQDSKTEQQPRSLAESITATRVPQVATQQTNQLSPNQSRCQQQQTESVESVQIPSSSPSSVESVDSVNTHTADLLEDVKYFHNAALSYQDAYEALQVQQAELQTKFTEQAQLVQKASEALKAVEAEVNCLPTGISNRINNLTKPMGS